MTATIEAPEVPEAPPASPPTTTSTPAPVPAPVRVLEVLCVRWDTITRDVVIEGHPGGEVFRRGAFAFLVAGGARLARRVLLTDTHIDGLNRRAVGHGIEFTETDEGLVGRFLVHPTPEGRSGWENLASKTYGGVSVGFRVNPQTADVRRVPTAHGDAREVRRARLDHVALVDEPAYRGSQVLALHETFKGRTTTTPIDPIDPADYPPPVHLLPPVPTPDGGTWAPSQGREPGPTSPAPAATPVVAAAAAPATTATNRLSDAELIAWARRARGTTLRGPTYTRAQVAAFERQAREARRAELYARAWREYPGAYYDHRAVADWMEAQADSTRSREYVWALAELAGVPHRDYCDHCRTKRSETSPCKYPRLTL